MANYSFLWKGEEETFLLFSLILQEVSCPQKTKSTWCGKVAVTHLALSQRPSTAPLPVC